MVLSFTLAHDRGDDQPANYFGTPLIDGRLHGSLRDKNYNIRNDVQRYHDEWTRLNTDWAINDSVSASNQLYYVKSRRHWRNAEDYRWDPDRDLLARQSYLEIRHNQEQVGDRQSLSFDHSLFGLTSKTVVGAEYNRIRFNVDSNSPYDDLQPGDFIDPWSPAPGRFHRDVSRAPARPARKPCPRLAPSPCSPKTVPNSASACRWSPASAATRTRSSATTWWTTAASIAA